MLLLPWLSSPAVAVVASPQHGACFSPAGLSRSLKSQPFSGSCSGSHDFPESSLCRVMALFWKRSSGGRPSAGWESLSFFWRSPNTSPNPSMKAQREGLKWPRQTKLSAWLLFCALCETQNLLHPHSNERIPYVKEVIFCIMDPSPPTAGLTHRKPGCGLAKAQVGVSSLANGLSWTGR